ncbi:MAG: 16S rRNA (cytosine(967)-C(5))-methyltransferase RsmB, partial [bacterium]
MADTGKVIAVDRNLKRLKLLIENMNRLKINSILAVVADSTKIALPKVDKILVDAPCSGLGILSKRSDLRWKRKLEDIFKIKSLQKSLLKNASKLLKSGGILVYSTCTLEPEENEEVVEEFLIKHKNYKLIPDSSLINNIFSTSKGYWTSFPHKHNIDGVFAAKLMKIN